MVVGHGPKGMVDHYISQSRAVSQPGREINMAAFDGNVSFTSCHFNVLSVPSATYISLTRVIRIGVYLDDLKFLDLVFFCKLSLSTISL